MAVGESFPGPCKVQETVGARQERSKGRKSETLDKGKMERHQDGEAVRAQRARHRVLPSFEKGVVENAQHAKRKTPERAPEKENQHTQGTTRLDVKGEPLGDAQRHCQALDARPHGVLGRLLLHRVGFVFEARCQASGKDRGHGGVGAGGGRSGLQRHRRPSARWVGRGGGGVRHKGGIDEAAADCQQGFFTA